MLLWVLCAPVSTAAKVAIETLELSAQPVDTAATYNGVHRLSKWQMASRSQQRSLFSWVLSCYSTITSPAKSTSSSSSQGSSPSAVAPLTSCGFSPRNRGAQKEFKTQAKYDEIKNSNWGDEIYVGIIDYATFCNEGDVPTRKQELAAFLGNISHETTAADAKIVPEKTWGLYWREEADWQKGSTALGYVDQYKNDLYPPAGGQSYHGRGPIQITHNINYGQLSEFFYGDKQILLDDPGKLVPHKPEDGTVAFMSAIWFWMTPQAPKPSCHDVMVGNWVPSAEDIAAGRDKSKFGMTVNIINGGLECDRPTDHRVYDRIDYYKRYIGLMEETAESNCECNAMQYYK